MFGVIVVILLDFDDFAGFNDDLLILGVFCWIWLFSLFYWFWMELLNLIDFRIFTVWYICAELWCFVLWVCCV